VKPRLYLETTIPSYLTSRSSRDLIIAGHQQLTKDWWETRRHNFDIYISQLVVDEASAGNPAAAQSRLKIIENLPLLDITPEVADLASDLLSSRIIPRKAATDAAHIAIAAVHAMDFLLTWNCVHIANAAISRALVSACRKHGSECPVIVWRIAMFRDPIIDEVRRIRETEAAKHRFDVKAILAASKKRQRRSKHKVVSFARKSTKLSA
jgi:hypothetical protein